MAHQLMQQARKHPQGFWEIDVSNFHQAANNIRVVDVREPGEFNGQLGHIPGAELVPLATVQSSASSWDPNEPLVLVCRSGARSAQAAQLLSRLGFKSVVNLQGGMMDYAHLKLHVDRS